MNNDGIGAVEPCQRLVTALKLARPLLQDERDRTASPSFRGRVQTVLDTIDIALAHVSLSPPSASEQSAPIIEMCAKVADEVTDWNETHLGESGYADLRRERIDTARAIAAGIRTLSPPSASEQKEQQ